MSVYVGDVSPKSIPILAITGGLDSNGDEILGSVNVSTADKIVVCGVRLNDATTFEWVLEDAAILSVATYEVNGVRELEAGDLSIAGGYLTRTTLFAGATMLWASDEEITINVHVKRTADPT